MHEDAKRFAHAGKASRPQRHQRFTSPQPRENGGRCPAQSFVFCEIPTQIMRFRVPADADGNMPVEHAAEMLALHCLALNRRLEDFEVSVLSESSLPPQVIERATQLIAAGRSIGAGVKLTAQEQVVLAAVVQNLRNKEIASKLNISVRTVKFHVASLFAKFKVSSRAALNAQAMAGQDSPSARSSSSRDAAGIQPRRSERIIESRPCLVTNSR
jgi:DNA-binding CsgD family transcriptional regulator